MTTRFVGMKELRQNMAKISKNAFLKKERLVVMRKNKPMFEVSPLSDGDIADIIFAREIARAEKDFVDKKFYTQREIEKMLGI